jgi:hypothetical protein
MNELFKIVSEIKKFKGSLYSFFQPTNEGNLIEFEKTIKYVLPNDYKNFLLFSNGAIILLELIYGINTEDKQFDGFSSYFFETEEAGNPMPKYLLPISPNGRGDHECLDLSTLTETKESCNIVFWQHDYAYDEEDKPRLVANSFYDYLLEIINDYLEDHNYDGTEKIKII